MPSIASDSEEPDQKRKRSNPSLGENFISADVGPSDTKQRKFDWKHGASELENLIENYVPEMDDFLNSSNSLTKDIIVKNNVFSVTESGQTVSQMSFQGNRTLFERTWPQYTAVSHSCCEAFITILSVDANNLDLPEQWEHFIENIKNSNKKYKGMFNLEASLR